MKKNISINISGIIFHIEEDGYDLLKGYLDAISRYFASYEDNEEIVADIEGRIAEIFLEKLKEDKQVISKEDIEMLIQTMGQIADFEAMESEEDLGEQRTQQQTEGKEEHKQQTRTSTSRRLERDTQRQLIGGVCSGLAYYFKTDPIWVRGLFLVLLFGGGISLIIYPILWIALSGNDNLPENDAVRKLYRDPDDRVIGGVSGGLAKYFNTDALLFRILFIIFAFSGFGILAYIVLWIITPKANSLTDKMQMKGEKVTLSNIDTTIKKKKEEELNPKGENAFTKIILFPFRLIAKIFSGLGRAIAPLFLFLVAAIRVFTGAIITLIAIVSIFSVLVTGGVLLGLYNGDMFLWDPELAYFPYEVFRNTIPSLGVVMLLVAIFIPFLYLFVAGLTIIVKRRVMSSAFGWSALGIWMISIVVSFAILPNIARDFRDEGTFRDSEVLAIEADTLLIDVNYIGYDYSSFYRYEYRGSYDRDSEFADLDLRPSTDGKYSINKRFRARGRNPRIAEENAEMVDFNYEINGNRLTFDSDITFPRGAKFYFQEVDVDLFIPKNQPFRVDRNTRSLIRYFDSGINFWEASRNVWMFDDEGNLVCLSCDEEQYPSISKNEEPPIAAMLEDFQRIKISRSIDVEYIESDESKIELFGPSNLTKNLSWLVSSGELSVISSGRANQDYSSVKMKIYGQGVDFISLSRNAKLEMKNSSGEALNISLNNARLILDGDYTDFMVSLFGESRIDIYGTFEKARIIAKDNSRVYGYDAEIEEAIVETESESRVRIKVNDFLRAEATGFSSVRYQGDPRVDIRNKSGSASISKY